VSPRHTFTIIPAINKVLNREEPPAEKKGSGSPVAGREPDTTAIFSITWESIIVIRPQVNSLR
jgi:hypothetical protein